MSLSKIEADVVILRVKVVEVVSPRTESEVVVIRTDKQEVVNTNRITGEAVL